MGNLNPADAAFELQGWHPDLQISPELASWLIGCSGEDLLRAADGAVTIEVLSKIMQHARHPDRGPGDLQARVLHGLAIGAKKIPIRGSDHIPFGTRELVLGARRSGVAVEGPTENRLDLRLQDEHLLIDWTGGKDHGFVVLATRSDAEGETEIVAKLRAEVDRLTEDLSKARRDTLATMTRARHAESSHELACTVLREEHATARELNRERDEHRREICEMAAKASFPSFTIRHAVCVGFARSHAKRRGWDCFPQPDATAGDEQTPSR